MLSAWREQDVVMRGVGWGGVGWGAVKAVPYSAGCSGVPGGHLLIRGGPFEGADFHRTPPPGERILVQPCVGQDTALKQAKTPPKTPPVSDLKRPPFQICLPP